MRQLHAWPPERQPRQTPQIKVKVEDRRLPGVSCISNTNYSVEGDTSALTDLFNRYIHDPDRWNICALVGSATYYRAAGVRLALDRHFSSRTSIDVLSSSDGYPTFQLALSLPFWAWRISEHPFLDPRHNGNNEPLRVCKDVSLLDPGRGPLRSFLYEAQVTCVVIGLVGERTWTAYCFDDTRHDGESAQNAHQHSEDVDAGVNTDPISYGVIDADKPIQEPFEYFIKIVAIRAKLVKDEWQKIVRKITLSIRRYDREHFPLTQDAAYWVFKDKAGGQQQGMNQSLKLVTAVKSISTTLLDSLTKTLDAYDGFQASSVPAFLSVSDASHVNRLMYDLPTTYRELRDLKKELESLVKRAEEFARELECRLVFDMNQTSSLQRELTETSNSLARASNEMAKCSGASAAIMLLYFSPIALGAGVFSMDQRVIRFLPHTFGSFMTLTFGFGLFGCVIWGFGRNA
ncbi:hypothetical protein LTR10_015250 [Elasticomyces elasticus]|uniref:Uncharacterized protein n=1 Tax=Exophiala sideris TaxID=1016849 RepID=A0ABR0JE97_9EURO|nr:hypothetical protein LTR10_015250 [Elasticomyces elasticus]KAK5032725.1 hypothetical protein LTS07_004135 [Exophiala sideris]KAK5037095.1 hypothetical protein LTR13_004900 [Exophiala sideris]KAK5062249.1 hypothetical protein LTR69_004607 [Exophiala sideris]KAK5182253.1 hypothetical protein LTR44_005264 [Eurotiomycetes sp. CCFEE 6388]